MKRPFYLAALLAAYLPCAYAQGQEPSDGQPPGGTRSGYGIFQTRCMSCHGNPDAAQRAPDPSVLRQLAPEKIYEALTTGVMKVQGQGLTDQQKRVVAESLSARPLGSAESGDAKLMTNQCASNPALADPSKGPAWNGWSTDLANTRYQTMKAAGLTADQLPRLKLKWAFGYPSSVSAFGQPTIAAGRVFVGSDNGYLYSLDAASGCVYWSFQAQGWVRNAVTVGPMKGHALTKYAVYFGDGKANLYAVDAQNGKLLWTRRVEDHFTARSTAGPTLHDGRLYVPVSSWEEYQGSNLEYPCCTFRGSIVALDANTGQQIWKTYIIPEEPKPTRKNSKGTQLFAPAGASVWNAPTVDVKRHAIYFGTGDAETEPAAKTSDAVMALDMNTGKTLWVYQAQKNDAWLGGCNGTNKTENCPADLGPDWDIGNSPILRTLEGGKRILVAGTKDGNVFALDPDKNGSVLWRVSIADKPRSGILWGGAADEHNVYYGLSGGGVAAVQLATGERAWFKPAEAARVSNAAAAAAIPGAAFVGGTDGKLRAMSTADGRTLWEFDTAQPFQTVNKVAAKGGSISAAGPTIAGGMVFVGSGYAIPGNEKPGNVLLAFGLE
jgi:polyvinyl alcohol dehydrogenase (cytochrome)